MAIGQSDSQIEVIKNYLLFYTYLLVIIIVLFVLRSLI